MAFSTLGWPNDTKEIKKYYPGSVLVTGFDIIFLGRKDDDDGYAFYGSKSSI